jgi:hypothetical protein
MGRGIRRPWIILQHPLHAADRTDFDPVAGRGFAAMSKTMGVDRRHGGSQCRHERQANPNLPQDGRQYHGPAF